MLTNRQIGQTVRGAFLPFRCAVHFWDSRCKLQLKVFNHERARYLEISKVPGRQIRDERQLGSILVRVRRQLQNEGYVFNPL